MTKRILLAVGEPARSEMLAARLQRAHAVATAEHGRQAIEMLREGATDLIVVDCRLPDMAAVEFVAAVRAVHKLPILVLIDARADWQVPLKVLAAGADNTLHESRFGELEAQIEDLLREWTQPVITRGPIVIDEATRTAELAGKPLPLTAFEYKVLKFLATCPDEWVSAQAIADHLYREPYDRIPSVAAEFVANLEKKLDPDGSLKPIALSDRGYRLVV